MNYWINTMNYEIEKQRVNFILWFWRTVPRSWLYWAVNQAWAQATCEKFTDKHPDEVSWSMTQNFLRGK